MEQHSIPITSTPASWLAEKQHLQRTALENYSSKEQNLLENGTTFESKYLYSNKLARHWAALAASCLGKLQLQGAECP
jgi:hypothetical protein